MAGRNGTGSAGLGAETCGGGLVAYYAARMSSTVSFWPPGAATGVGSMPGTDPGEAARLVFGELPDLPYLPELPARGPGADLLGRGATFLAELYVDLQPAGWRLVPRPGIDSRRARDLLQRDLDALQEAADGYAGALKLQAAGPWTLAAGIELRRGDKALSDPGAVVDIAAALAEGIAAYVADVGRRVPDATLLLQLDEPSLPQVLRGEVPTASGFGRLRAVETPVATDRLRTVLAAVTAASTLPVVHCCATNPPVELLLAAGARGLSLDVTALTTKDDDALGVAVEAGVPLFLGTVPSTDAELSDPGRTVTPVRALWRRLGFEPERLAGAVVVTPTCGLAVASPAYARAALRRCREAGQLLVDEPDGAG